MVKSVCVQDAQSYFIQEYVNADFYRYYLIQQVENRPYFLRITLFTKASPEAQEKRGKDVYRSLAMLKTFISLQNRQGQMQIQIKRSDTDASQLVATMGAGANTAFTNFVADESDSGEEGSDLAQAAGLELKTPQVIGSDSKIAEEETKSQL